MIAPRARPLAQPCSSRLISSHTDDGQHLIARPLGHLAGGTIHLDQPALRVGDKDTVTRAVEHLAPLLLAGLQSHLGLGLGRDVGVDAEPVGYVTGWVAQRNDAGVEGAQPSVAAAYGKTISSAAPATLTVVHLRTTSP